MRITTYTVRQMAILLLPTEMEMNECSFINQWNNNISDALLSDIVTTWKLINKIYAILL